MSGQTVHPNGSYRAGYYFNAVTVHDSGVSDHLEDEGGQDWYFASLGDKIEQLSRGDVVAKISFGPCGDAGRFQRRGRGDA
jgi:hypothetical protein